MQQTPKPSSLASSLLWLAGAAAILGGLAALVVLVIVPWLYPKVPVENDPTVEDARGREKVPVPQVFFKDVTKQAGITFIHNNGSTGQKLLPETMGSGVAFIDYNNDGHQDILFINACDWPGAKPRPHCTKTLALYENQGDGTFKDVTRKVGLDIVMYGMGVTVGDFDNDGNPDIYITGVGGNKLFRNVLVRKENSKEIHRFEEVTDKANLLLDEKVRWPAHSGKDFLKHKEPINFSSSATFLDYDGDGWLDLFVCNYVTWSPAQDLARGAQRVGMGQRNFEPPTTFPGAHCILYRNRGKDKEGNWLGFEDVSEKAGIRVFTSTRLKEAVAKGLGVVACHVDDHGYPDVLVACDTRRNLFFRNQGDGTFKEIGIRANVAYVDGVARGAMGADAAEYRPGRFGVAIGNFANEPDTFLRLTKDRLFFTDVAANEGIGGPSRELLKFGVFFFDYDLDGRLDLLTCNGQLEPEIKNLDSSQSYQQPVQLFWNTGRKEASFEPVTDKEAGKDLFVPLVGRGCAYGDIDGDGFPDVVLVENGGPARLLRNQGGTGNHCIRLELRGDGKRSNKSAIGARVALTVGEDLPALGATTLGLSTAPLGTAPFAATAALLTRKPAVKRVLKREVAGARGYLSQSELPLTFGLGKANVAARVVIQWPGKKGGTLTLKGLRADTYYVVEQGKGIVAERPLRKR